MSQQDVISFLRQNKGKSYTAEELSREIPLNINPVQKALKSLRKENKPFVFRNSFKTELKWKVEDNIIGKLKREYYI